MLLGINYISWFSVSCGFDGFCLFVGFPLLLGSVFFLTFHTRECGGDDAFPSSVVELFLAVECGLIFAIGFHCPFLGYEESEGFIT